MVPCWFAFSLDSAVVSLGEKDVWVEMKVMAGHMHSSAFPHQTTHFVPLVHSVSVGHVFLVGICEQAIVVAKFCIFQHEF